MIIISNFSFFLKPSLFMVFSKLHFSYQIHSIKGLSLLCCPFSTLTLLAHLFSNPQRRVSLFYTDISRETIQGGNCMQQIWSFKQPTEKIQRLSKRFKKFNQLTKSHDYTNQTLFRSQININLELKSLYIMDSQNNVQHEEKLFPKLFIRSLQKLKAQI